MTSRLRYGAVSLLASAATAIPLVLILPEDSQGVSSGVLPADRVVRQGQSVMFKGTSWFCLNLPRAQRSGGPEVACFRNVRSSDPAGVGPQVTLKRRSLEVISAKRPRRTVFEPASFESYKFKNHRFRRK